MTFQIGSARAARSVPEGRPTSGRFRSAILKYVNMADLNLPLVGRPSGTDRAARAEPIWNVIELLFFAYRDFIGDPDDVLAKLSFGRGHHRSERRRLGK